MLHVIIILWIIMKQLTSFWNLYFFVMNLWYSFSFPPFPEGSVYTPELLFNSPSYLQQSCGSGVLADGRLADLIRRVATFGMVLMKLDLRQVKFIFHVYVYRSLCKSAMS
jgi:phosphoenolpyruvate carboxylase